MTKLSHSNSVRDPSKSLNRVGIRWRIIVVLAICLAYANSFHNSFHFDDFHTVVDNPTIRSLQNVPLFFTNATTFSVLPANRTYTAPSSPPLLLWTTR